MDEALLNPVFAEIKRQDVKWGKNRTHPDEWWYAILGEEFGEIGTALLETHFRYKTANSDDIRKELIHVIAVGIQWLNSMDILERDNE
jgi:hypothetical protein